MSREEQVARVEALADFERAAQAQPDVIHEINEPTAETLGFESSVGLTNTEAASLCLLGLLKFEQVVVQYTMPEGVSADALRMALENAGVTD